MTPFKAGETVVVSSPTEIPITYDSWSHPWKQFIKDMDGREVTLLDSRVITELGFTIPGWTVDFSGNTFTEDMSWIPTEWMDRFVTRQGCLFCTT